MSKRTADIDTLVEQIAGSKKYRNVGIAPETVRDILLTELARQPNEKAAIPWAIPTTPPPSNNSKPPTPPAMRRRSRPRVPPC